MSAERPPRGRSRGLAALLAFLALVAAGGLVRQAATVRRAIAYARAAAPSPFAWRPRGVAVVELDQLLSGFVAQLPPGCRVAVEVPPALAGEAHYVRSWAAFLRPDRIWRTFGDDPRRTPGDLVLAWSTRLDDPALELLAEAPGGAVYRRRW